MDSSHEVDETYLELALYYKVLAPGGLLFGDDYQWVSVRFDVDRFVQFHNLQLRTDANQRMWAIPKPPIRTEAMRP